MSHQKMYHHQTLQHGVMVIVGPALSYVQLNWVAAVLLLLAPSVKVPPATSIVVATCCAGRKGGSVNR